MNDDPIPWTDLTDEDRLRGRDGADNVVERLEGREYYFVPESAESNA